MSELSPEEKFHHLMRTDESFRSKILEIGGEAFYSIIRDGVRHGDLSIRGKPRAEFIMEACDYVQKRIDGDITLVTDYRDSLLEEAHRAVSQERLVIAIVLYATYFEHALNDLIIASCARAKLGHSIAMRLIRGSTIFDKTGDLLVDVGLPKLSNDVAVGIRKTAELRNEFVHYKWIGRSDEEEAAHKTQIADTISSAEVAVSGLDEYEKQALLEGFEEILMPNQSSEAAQTCDETLQ